MLSKITQIVMLIAYLYYLYKINAESEYTQRQYSKQLFMVAISMGANIGVSNFIWAISTIIELKDLLIVPIIGTIFLLIQQCVIVITFMCTPKMSRLCKGLFSKATNK